eukprot:gene140-3530_t
MDTAVETKMKSTVSNSKCLDTDIDKSEMFLSRCLVAVADTTRIRIVKQAKAQFMLTQHDKN